MFNGKCGPLSSRQLGMCVVPAFAMLEVMHSTRLLEALLGRWSQTGQARMATRYSNLSAGAGSVTCLHARMLSRPVKLNMRSEVLVQTWVIANASGKAESLADICTEILQWPPGLHAVQ